MSGTAIKKIINYFWGEEEEPEEIEEYENEEYGYDESEYENEDQSDSKHYSIFSGNTIILNSNTIEDSHKISNIDRYEEAFSPVIKAIGIIFIILIIMRKDKFIKVPDNKDNKDD